MTVSPAMRRYAAEIYRLQQDHEQVSLSLLSSYVESSAQAISTMVKRLNKNGYLVHEPYRGVRLTPAGEKIAMPALRRHRLTEVFLVKVMNYDWASAHELSDVFERGVNDEIEDRMDELAGHPTRCPHGEPIPSKDGVMPKVEDMPLVDVPSGSDCVVSRVRTHNMEKLHYIGELGLVPGTPFHLLSCAPFKGPLRLQMKPQDHIIGYELSQSIWVEVKKLGEGNKLPPLKTPRA
ncbi:MAG TPA: metal-dependent transcriptional regulator [Anaerolineales bacterium]|nr:metal-dependent transcriptional regulator [Anaerolineales bacterium]